MHLGRSTRKKGGSINYNYRSKEFGAGIAIGLGIGVIFGIALGNIVSGILIGAIFGVGLGVAFIISTQLWRRRRRWGWRTMKLTSRTRLWQGLLCWPLPADRDGLVAYLCGEASRQSWRVVGSTARMFRVPVTPLGDAVRGLGCSDPRHRRSTALS